MGDVKNLIYENAVEKMRELAMSARVGFFQTNPGSYPCKGRPMTVVNVDNEGKLWFFSKLSSNKNAQIKRNHEVEIIFARPEASEFLCVFGDAEIVMDKSRIDALWQPWLKTWFQKGKDDRDISLICVKPAEAHYWDVKHNKAVVLVKKMLGAMTGIAMDDAVEGSLRV